MIEGQIEVNGIGAREDRSRACAQRWCGWTGTAESLLGSTEGGHLVGVNSSDRLSMPILLAVDV